MLAIMGAMDEEISVLLAELQERTDLEVLGGTLYQGILDGQKVLICKCGIGKVNAALSTAALVAAGATRLVFTGVAGGVHPDLKVGDIVISRDLLQADVDVTALGYDLGTVPGEQARWQADAELQTIAQEAARKIVAAEVTVQVGCIASGDQFVASVAGVRRIHEQFGADCVEMEGAAVAQVCHKARLPFVVIRSISDTADQGANVDYQTFMPRMAERAAEVVHAMLPRLRA